MRYRSFPIPLRHDDLSTGIIPRLDRDVLAISNGKERLSLEVKFSDLMECHQLNSIYLCDRHGVLDQLEIRALEPFTRNIWTPL